MNFRGAVLAFLLILISRTEALAITRVVGNTTLQIGAQSQPESNAHWIATTQANVCAANRMYIDFSNKELFAMALSAFFNNQVVNVAYEDSASAATVPPHGNITCKVLSIWWP